MAGKYVLKKAKNGQFHFNLMAGNGEIILASELYTTKAAALNGIESVKKNSAVEGRYKKLESKKGDPYFVLRAGNHQVIGKSEMYSDNRACTNGMKSVMKNGPTAATDDQS